MTNCVESGNMEGNLNWENLSYQIHQSQEIMSLDKSSDILKLLWDESYGILIGTDKTLEKLVRTTLKRLVTTNESQLKRYVSGIGIGTDKRSRLRMSMDKRSRTRTSTTVPTRGRFGI